MTSLQVNTVELHEKGGKSFREIAVLRGVSAPAVRQAYLQAKRYCWYDSRTRRGGKCRETPCTHRGGR